MVIAFSNWAHPFFVAVIDIRHNEKEKTLEVSVKSFTDDFETALKQNFPGSKPNLMGPSSAKDDTLIRRYILSKLTISANGKPLTMHYIGHERVEESTWSYFEISHIDKVNSLTVTTDFLYEFKKEQINIIHARLGDVQKSYRLSQPERTVQLMF